MLGDEGGQDAKEDSKQYRMVCRQDGKQNWRMCRTQNHVDVTGSDPVWRSLAIISEAETYINSGLLPTPGGGGGMRSFRPHCQVAGLHDTSFASYL